MIGLLVASIALGLFAYFAVDLFLLPHVGGGGKRSRDLAKVTCSYVAVILGGVGVFSNLAGRIFVEDVPLDSLVLVNVATTLATWLLFVTDFHGGAAAEQKQQQDQSPQAAPSAAEASTPVIKRSEDYFVNLAPGKLSALPLAAGEDEGEETDVETVEDAVQKAPSVPVPVHRAEYSPVGPFGSSVPAPHPLTLAGAVEDEPGRDEDNDGSKRIRVYGPVAPNTAPARPHMLNVRQVPVKREAPPGWDASVQEDCGGGGSPSRCRRCFQHCPCTAGSPPHQVLPHPIRLDGRADDLTAKVKGRTLQIADGLTRAKEAAHENSTTLLLLAIIALSVYGVLTDDGGVGSGGRREIFPDDFKVLPLSSHQSQQQQHRHECSNFFKSVFKAENLAGL